MYPAVVYFAPGSYLVSSPIIQYYNTQLVNDTEGARFVSGVNLQAANRSSSLVGNTVYNVGRPNFFNRRRPKYNDIGNSQVLDVKALGAKGDGKTDDTTVGLRSWQLVLNSRMYGILGSQ